MDSSDQERTVGFSTPPALEAVSSRFELLGALGHGGMGVVYRARDRHTGDLVALKVLHPGSAYDPAVIERFKKELIVTRRITHKNVCRVHDLIDIGGTAVISMELLTGDTLRALLRQVGSVSVRHGTRIIKQVIAGLAEAHAQGVVHRDLKPENIFIARDGVVKVMDFGIARTPESSDTKTGVILGTPAYMSPEQAAGGAADTRSDIYSIGLVMYEMFCGRPAFAADTPAALVAKQINDQAPPPHELDPDVPARIERAILKCLEKNPDKRFQSVLEVEAALDEKPVAAAVTADTNAPLPDHLARWQARDTLLVGGAVAGLLAFVTCFAQTSLAPRSQVAFDRSLLRRIVQEHLSRLGVPVGPDITTTSQVVAPSPYVYVAEKAGAAVARDLTNNPIHYWTWRGEQGSSRVVVDNRGGLVSFSRSYADDGALPRLEDSRILAEKAIGDFYNQSVKDLAIDRAGSDGQVNAFRWLNLKSPYGLRETYSVEMDARGIAALSRSILPPSEYRSHEPAQEDWCAPVAIALGTVMSILGFLQRRRLNGAARWRTMLCGLAFLTGFGVALSMHAYWTGSGVVFPLALALGVLMALFWLLTSMAVEKQFLRDRAAKLQTFVWLFDGRVRAQPVGLSIVRGTLLGLALLGLDAAAILLSTTYFGARLHDDLHLWFLGWLLNGTDWPVPVLLAWSAMEAFGITLIVAFVDSIGSRLIAPRWLSALAAAVFLAMSGIHNTIGSVQPFYWTMILLFVDYMVLIVILRRFDLLTLVTAILTFAFWWGNYALYVMLHAASSVQPTIAFAVWALCAIVAAAIAFQSTLRTAVQRMAAAVD